MNFVDIKYINLLSHKLRNFQQKGSNYNFSCPLCGDSATKKRRARAYLLAPQGTYYFYCHNCNRSLTFFNFLKEVAPELFDSYRLEHFFKKDKETSVIETIHSAPKFVDLTLFNKLIKVSKLPDNHIAKQFIQQRKIPTEYHWKLFYCPRFMSWTNEIVPEKFSKEHVRLYEEDRIVIPFVDEKKRVYGFQGRNLKLTGPKYITIALDKTQHVLFGRDTVNIKETIYVLEGPFDSMFLPNAVAVASSNLTVASKLLPKDKLVLIFDNEPRNKQIHILMTKAIKENFQLVIFPQSFKHKDINAAICKGMSEAEILEMVKNNTCRGLRALLSFKEWERA